MEFGLSLPSGTVLEQGNCLILEAENVLIEVVEANEKVLLINPLTQYQWAYWAYQIGNRHQALMITENELVCMDEPAVSMLLLQLKVPFRKAVRAFRPAIKVSGHTH
ncbi:MAG: hypothetical protein HQM12_18790 [SAR324 cluster bacterium]|nr:hypothetical protein [SAR324 cluster bacterium]